MHGHFNQYVPPCTEPEVHESGTKPRVYQARTVPLDQGAILTVHG